MSQIETRKAIKSLDDEIPDVKLFQDKVIPDQFFEIMEFLMSG
jgi:hypothetical protein